MEILAGLVKLANPSFLPAPWFNRPALGLVTNTDVRVGVVKATTQVDAPPDIIVTPLRTDRLHCTGSVTIDLEEGTGAVSRVLKHIPSHFNIALAETVTIDHRTRHRITLLLEPPGFKLGRTAEDSLEYKEYLKDLRESLSVLPGFIDMDKDFVVDNRTVFEKQDTSIIQHGEVNFNSIKNWYKKTYFKKFEAQYDFSKVVISSSDEGRFIRYIFPKRGVFEATISHLDAPGALAHIAGVFEELDYNILLSRLSRSTGRRPAAGKSIYVAICEPANLPGPNISPDSYAIDVGRRVRAKVDADSNHDYQLALTSVSLGASPDRVAYPYRHGITPSINTIVAQQELSPFLNSYKRMTTKAVFLSYRHCLTDSTPHLTMQNAVVNALQKLGARVYDGFTRPTSLRDEDAADLRARIWMSNAAIFFACDEKGDGVLSENQFVEWGLIYGQGKPWVVIVKSGQETNVKKFMIPEKAFITYRDINSAESVDSIVKQIESAYKRWFPGDLIPFSREDGYAS